MPDSESIEVCVVYALSERQKVVRLAVPADTTVAQAVAQSGLTDVFPEIAAAPLHCAIFGRHVPLAHRVTNADRIEILRPLRIDPKESRRRRAAPQR
jgi:uncharacterized protein